MQSWFRNPTRAACGGLAELMRKAGKGYGGIRRALCITVSGAIFVAAVPAAVPINRCSITCHVRHECRALVKYSPPWLLQRVSRAASAKLADWRRRRERSEGDERSASFASSRQEVGRIGSGAPFGGVEEVSAGPAMRSTYVRPRSSPCAG